MPSLSKSPESLFNGIDELFEALGKPKALEYFNNRKTGRDPDPAVHDTFEYLDNRVDKLREEIETIKSKARPLMKPISGRNETSPDFEGEKKIKGAQSGDKRGRNARSDADSSDPLSLVKTKQGSNMKLESQLEPKDDQRVLSIAQQSAKTKSEPGPEVELKQNPGKSVEQGTKTNSGTKSKTSSKSTRGVAQPRKKSLKLDPENDEE